MKMFFFLADKKEHNGIYRSVNGIYAAARFLDVRNIT